MAILGAVAAAGATHEATVLVVKRAVNNRVQTEHRLHGRRSVSGGGRGLVVGFGCGDARRGDAVMVAEVCRDRQFARRLTGSQARRAQTSSPSYRGVWCRAGLEPRLAFNEVELMPLIAHGRAESLWSRKDAAGVRSGGHST